MNPIMKNALGGSSIKLFGLYQPPLRSSCSSSTPKSDPLPKSLAKERNHHQHQAIPQTVTDTVQEAHARVVLHRETFRASHHDAVGDDQSDKHRQAVC